MSPGVAPNVPFPHPAPEDGARRREVLDALRRLAGGIAHEFNNFLTGFIAYAEIASTRAGDDSRIRAPLEQMRALAQRASALTRQLLAFGQRQSLNLAPVDLNAIARDALSSLRERMGAKVELAFHTAQGILPVRADAEKIRQALLELWLFASEGIGGGVVLHAATDVVQHHDPKTGHPPALSCAVISLSHAGPGPSPEAAAHAFEPLSGEGPADLGRALALAAAYGTIAQHGGSVELESSPDKGVGVRVFLPLGSGVAEGPVGCAHPRLQPDAAPGGCSILLVEDEAPVREVIEHILREKGYTVFCAGGSEEAERLFDAASRPFDLLLTDIVMPGRDGRDLYECLRRKHPRLRVLYMSGYTDRALLRMRAAGGPAPFLQKPFAPDALLRKVAEALGCGP